MPTVSVPDANLTGNTESPLSARVWLIAYRGRTVRKSVLRSISNVAPADSLWKAIFRLETPIDARAVAISELNILRPE